MRPTRTRPILPLRPGIPERQTHDYKRNGTTSLYAALNTLTGKVIGRCLPRHTHEEFIAFLKVLDRETPKAPVDGAHPPTLGPVAHPTWSRSLAGVRDPHRGNVVPAVEGGVSMARQDLRVPDAAQRRVEEVRFVETLFGRRSRRFAVGATIPDGR